VDNLSQLEMSLARLAACGTSCGSALLPAHFQDLYDKVGALHSCWNAVGPIA
jgi:hypothetical protein